MKRGGSSHRAAGAPRAALPPGRRAKTWLSPEFLAWCKRHRLKPEKIAECVVHTFALQHPGTHTIHLSSQRPIVDGEFLDRE